MPTQEETIILGNENTTQLTVKGYTTQTAPLQSWQDSNNIELVRVTGKGNVQSGSTAIITTEDALVEIQRSETDTTKPKRGLHVMGRIAQSLSDSVIWVMQKLTLSGTTASTQAHKTLQVELENTNTGNMAGSSLIGGDFQVRNQGGNSGSPVSEAIGLNVNVTNVSGGHLSKATGIKVSTEGSSGDNYALQVEKGAVQLNDRMDLKKITTVPAAPPVGTVRTYVKSDGKLYAKDSDNIEYNLMPGGLAYLERIKNTETANLIAYYPFNDALGAASINDESTANNDATYSGVTLNVDGIGDGQRAASFDGNDYATFYTSGFNTAFNRNQGTILAWIKVSAAV